MNTELSAAIAAKQAELDALREEARQAEASQRAEEARVRNAAAITAIAGELGSTEDLVGAFLSKVAQRSGLDVDYLVHVINSTERHAWA